MDSGCLEEGEDLEDDFDFSKPLSAGQVVCLMDDLMCREVNSCAIPTFSQADLFRLRGTRDILYLKRSSRLFISTDFCRQNRNGWPMLNLCSLHKTETRIS
jgi:Mak10 subunit, NatC N(alpha)-terminal acetyltransferase